MKKEMIVDVIATRVYRIVIPAADNKHIAARRAVTYVKSGKVPFEEYIERAEVMERGEDEGTTINLRGGGLI